jgi:uncharacterized surface protein with fasciclin (FAS1) repeats
MRKPTHSRRTLRTLAAATATALVGGLGLAGPSASAAPGNQSLATVLDADGDRFDRNWEDFDILDRAVRTVLGAKPSSPVGVLAQGDQRLTAFAPTDRAFRRLVNDVTGSKPATERATFNTIAGAYDVDTIEAVLLYHVVPGAKINYKTARNADGARLEPAAGPHIVVRVRGGEVFLRDADRDDPNPQVIRALKNINSGNRQIAHGISRVLRPLDL